MTIDFTTRKKPSNLLISKHWRRDFPSGNKRAVYQMNSTAGLHLGIENKRPNYGVHFSGHLQTYDLTITFAAKYPPFLSVDN